MAELTRGDAGGRSNGGGGGRAAGAPRTKPAEQRRAELMAAAERLFLAQGPEATSVEQITRAAGVAKGSFYLQFATREELLEALRRRFLEDYLEELDALVGEVPAEQHATRLAVWTAVTLSAFLDQGERRALLFRTPQDYRLPSAGADPVARLAALLGAGRRAGAWALPEAEAAAGFLFHGLLGLLDAPPAGRDRAAIEEAAMALVERLVLSGG